MKAWRCRGLSPERTNILLGAVHLLLFLAYLILIFEN
jgi:Ca2+/H+ antiporter